MIALLSDIHSNFEALNACLRHAKESGADRYAFLGDLVGYGADPQAVIDIVARFASEGAVVVRGNHDEAVRGSSGYMNDAAAEAIEWTRTVLSDAGKAFLEALPLCVREGPNCFVHASAARPEKWNYVDGPAEAVKSMEAARGTYTFSGHVHDQELFFQLATGKVGRFKPMAGRAVPILPHRRWLALVGSVGQPRDANPAAAYALFDGKNASITFHRVPYDSVGAANKIRAAGLPVSTAHRVEKGV